jgi:hypothetical protein
MSLSTRFSLRETARAGRRLSGSRRPRACVEWWPWVACCCVYTASDSAALARLMRTGAHPRILSRASGCNEKRAVKYRLRIGRSRPLVLATPERGRRISNRFPRATLAHSTSGGSETRVARPKVLRIMHLHAAPTGRKSIARSVSPGFGRKGKHKPHWGGSAPAIVLSPPWGLCSLLRLVPGAYAPWLLTVAALRLQFQQMHNLVLRRGGPNMRLLHTFRSSASSVKSQILGRAIRYRWGAR